MDNLILAIDLGKYKGVVLCHGGNPARDGSGRALLVLGNFPRCVTGWQNDLIVS